MTEDKFLLNNEGLETYGKLCILQHLYEEYQELVKYTKEWRKNRGEE